MLKIFQKQYASIAALFIIIAASVGGAFYLGYQKGTEKPKTVLVEGVSNINAGNSDSVNFNLFWNAWQLLKDKSVDSKNLTDKKLLYGSIEGIFNSLGDPYTVFMPPSDAQKFTEDISGEFSGIGAQIDVKDNQLVVIAPLKDSPADKAGLKPMDKILYIDATSTVGMSVDDAVIIIRGQKGTRVVLTVSRDGWAESKDISIVRDTIQVPTIDSEILDLSGVESKDGGIAYIHLYNFYENAPALFYQAIVNMSLKNPRGLVLDLRGNPGGYLDGAINIAGWFMDKGKVVVNEKFGNGQNQTYESYGTGYLKNLPVVVLIDQGSASASEILAGALRDQRGIKLVGEKSFGKGTVQEVDQLSDGSLAKITVAHWLTPNGQLIDKNGLEPDYKVSISESDISAGKDPQLDKALEVIKGEISSENSSPLDPFLKIEVLPS